MFGFFGLAIAVTIDVIWIFWILLFLRFGFFGFAKIHPAYILVMQILSTFLQVRVFADFLALH